MEPCQETRLFAKDESAWVYIHHIDNDGFLWVMLMTEVGVMESVSRILNSEDHIPLNDPAADNIVCALHVSDNTWYRARIISTGPTCTVHFIDYGDTLDLPRENLAPLPDILSGIHPLAMKVKLPSLTEAEPSVGSTLLLQYIDCVNGEVTVDVILPDSDGSLPLLVEISDQSQTQQFPQVDPEQHSCTPSNISQSISETFLISQPKEENVTCEFKEFSHPDNENVIHVEGSTSVMLCENQAANVISNTAENDASCSGQKCIPETAPKEELTMVGDSQTSVDPCVIPDSDEAMSQTEELRLTSNEIPLNSEKECNLAAHSSCNQSVSNKLSVLLSVLQKNEEESCAAVDLGNVSAFPPNSSSLNTQEGYEQIISPHKSEDLSLPEDENLMHVEGSTSVMLCENQAANAKSITAENDASCFGQKCIPETVLKDEPTIVCDSQTSDSCVIPDSDEAMSQTEELRLTSNEIPLNSEKDCNLAHSSFNQSVSNKLSVLQTNEEESCAAVDLVNASAFPPNSSSLNTQEGYEQIISPHKSEDLSLPEDENLMHIEGSTSVMLCENQAANVKSNTAENGASCSGQKCIPETVLKEEATMAGESQTSVDPCVIPDSDEALSQTEELRLTSNEIPLNSEKDCNLVHSSFNQSVSNKLSVLQTNEEESCAAVDLVYLSAFPPNSSSLNTQEGYEQIISPHKSEDLSLPEDENLMHIEGSTSVMLCENQPANVKSITAENDTSCFGQKCIPETALKEEAIMAGESQTSVDPFVIPDSDYAVCQTEQVDAMCSEKPGSEDHYAPVGVEPLTLVECAPALSNLNQAGSDELPSLPNDDDSCCKSEEMPNTLNEDLIYTEESTFALCENRTINEKLITAENDGLFAEESSIPVTFDGDQVKTEVSSPSLACVDHSAHFAVDPCEILQCCEAVGKTEGLYLTNSENLQDTVNFNHTLSSTEQPARDKLLIQQAASTKEEVLLSGKDCSASLIDLDQPVPKERSANSQNSQHDTLIDKDMPKDIKDEKAEIDHIKDSSSGQSPVNHLAVKSTSFSVDQHSSAEGVNISSYIPEDLSQVLRNDKFNCPQKPRIISKRHTAESSCQDESRAPNYMQAASCSETTMPTNVGSSSSQEFETILEFELDILREQHRLQMFALQKRMEKHAEYQINAFRVEMSRQFDSLFNELNNRIQFINDSVVHKMANLYSEITMLKNEQEVTKINNPAELDSQFGNNFNLNSSQNKMPINIHNQNPSFENNTVNQPRMKSNPVELDSQFGNNCNLNSSQNKMPINPHNQNPTFENYTVSQPRMKSRGRITERPNCDQSSTEMMDHHSNLGLNSDQYNSSKYPKMDHFESKPELKVEKIEKRQQQSKVILVSNLNDVEVKIDHLFNLFGLYGNICVIKIEKGKAFVEMADANQAAEVIRNLNNVPLRGKQLRLYPSKWEKINITREDLQANTCKDFKKTAMKNLQRTKFNNFPPSKTLKIYNLSITVSDDKIHELFAKEGFNIRRLNIVSMNNSEKKLAYVSFDSIEEAVNALTVMHNQETSDWVKMKIVFSRN